MVKLKYSNKNIKFSCVFVSVVLALQTIILGIVSIIALNAGARELADAATHGGNPLNCSKLVSNDSNLLGSETLISPNSLDESAELILPKDDEELISPEDEALVSNMTPTECYIENAQREILNHNCFEAALTRMHLTMVVLLSATVLSLMICLGYFSLLGTRLPDIFKKD